jgi:uncharacterized membrane protein YbhN (UPF0104 family)
MQDELAAADQATSDRSLGLRGRRRGRALITGLVGIGSFALLLWVAPPSAIVDQITDMRLSWVIAAVGFEIASCLSYVIVFRRFFPEPPRSVSHQVAWIAMGAGAVLPGGNISSAAATGWLLRSHGVDTTRLLKRCASLLCLLTAVGFVVNGIAGLVLLAGIPGGPHDISHTGIPILVSVAVLALAALFMTAARRAGAHAPLPIRAIAAGLEGAWAAVGQPHWRLLGAAGFIGLDMAALWAACAATGHPIGLPAVGIAYCIGYLATALPIPAGVGVLDSGLAGALVLYGLSPAASVGAVLVYHAIAIWVPGIGGLTAWLPIRRRRREAMASGGLAELGALPVAGAGETA